MVIQRLQVLLRSLAGSFWFAPSLMAVSALALALGLLSLERGGPSPWFEGLGPPFTIGIEGARSLLSTIAGSVITVASLVFSLTLVALTLAAGSIGARLLQRYMQKRTIQVTLGVFVATYVYTLIVQSAVGGEEHGVPRLAVIVALLLAIASLFWLLFAFHDLARTIQVDNAVTGLSADLVAALSSFAIDSDGRRGSEEPAAPQEGPLRLTVPAGADGYVRSIDYEALVKLAVEGKAFLRVRCRSGDYLLRDATMAELSAPADVAAAETLAKRAAKAFLLGPSRSEQGDPTFRVHLLVEIALRALSPGVNDLYTALICIDHLGSALAVALRLRLRSGRYCDAEGHLRVLGEPLTFGTLADAAFNPIRQSGAHMPPVALRLLGLMAQLADLAAREEEAAVLRRHADAVKADAERADLNKEDLAAIERAHAATSAKLPSTGTAAG